MVHPLLPKPFQTFVHIPGSGPVTGQQRDSPISLLSFSPLCLLPIPNQTRPLSTTASLAQGRESTATSVQPAATVHPSQTRTGSSTVQENRKRTSQCRKSASESPSRPPTKDPLRRILKTPRRPPLPRTRLVSSEQNLRTTVAGLGTNSSNLRQRVETSRAGIRPYVPLEQRAERSSFLPVSQFIHYVTMQQAQQNRSNLSSDVVQYLRRY